MEMLLLMLPLSAVQNAVLDQKIWASVVGGLILAIGVIVWYFYRKNIKESEATKDSLSAFKEEASRLFAQAETAHSELRAELRQERRCEFDKFRGEMVLEKTWVLDQEILKSAILVAQNAAEQACKKAEAAKNNLHMLERNYHVLDKDVAVLMERVGDNTKSSR